MPPVSKDEVIGELLEAIETAPTLAEKQARVQKLSAQWEPTFPGIGAEFARLAGFAKLFQKPAPPATDLPIPASLPGFLDLTPIGAGGYGVVCSATQLPFHRRVAVKIRSAGSSPTAEERFDREQRVLARLHHTNIVPVHLSGRHGPYQFFVMKLIDGATLADLVASLSDQTAPPAAITTLADHAAKTADSRSREKLPTSVPSALGHPAAVPAVAAEAPRFPVPPPASYFRSVAAVIAAAADALAHAHAAGVLHRDVKPSNIMVGRDGLCSIIDFGLAALGVGEGDPDTAQPNDALTQGALGTTPYMAPEQFHRKPEARSDVWGLGATLYELLTLRRAYPKGAFQDAKSTVPAAAPERPRTACPSVPPDLEAICLKALERDPEKRYPSPADVAEDLRRWQRGEATTARPRPPLVRAVMWARRNPAGAATLTSAVLFFFAAAAAGVWNARAAAANANAKAAEEREKTTASQAETHASLLTSLQGKRLTRYPTAKWSQEALEIVRRAAAIRADEPLRTQAVALLTGLDAVPRPSFPDISGSSVAFDEKGRLLIGGFADSPARLWDGSANKPLASQQLGQGPVAFRKDGTPLQLAVTPEDRNALALWDVGAQKLIRHLTVPGATKKNPPTQNDPGAKATLSADGKFAAAVVYSRVGPVTTYQTVAWDADTGAVVFNEFPDSTATAIAVGAADAGGKSCLALGDSLGRVTTWSLPEGRKLSTLKVDHGAVTALAVGDDVRRGERVPPVPALRNRLLAVGSGTSRVAVWELESSSVRSFCHGSAYAVYALAFSPDGVTLVSAGRNHPRLWDVATGRLLLELGNMDYVHGITFSPDGRSVAFTGR
ncbi:MAG TPA: serine/threonine-protein kinase, partial [Gemmataceae bacterium]|nr:serine/threonine-protein kinase [Gemmataceae bacterium]